jgi:hypothetical protein
LVGNAAPVEADAAEVLALDDRRLEAELRGADRGHIAAGSGAEHDYVVDSAIASLLSRDFARPVILVERDELEAPPCNARLGIAVPFPRDRLCLIGERRPAAFNSST